MQVPIPVHECVRACDAHAHTHARRHQLHRMHACTHARPTRECSPLPDARGALAYCRHHGGSYAPPRRLARAAASAARPAASARTCVPPAARPCVGTVRRWASDAKAHGTKPTNKQTAVPQRNAKRQRAARGNARGRAQQRCNRLKARTCSKATWRDATAQHEPATTRETNSARRCRGRARRRGAQRCDLFVGRVEQKVDDVVPKATQSRCR